MTRTCKECQRPLVGRQRAHCSNRCKKVQQYQREKVKRDDERRSDPARFCIFCKVDISDRHRLATRCASCKDRVNRLSRAQRRRKMEIVSTSTRRVTVNGRPVVTPAPKRPPNPKAVSYANRAAKTVARKTNLQPRAPTRLGPTLRKKLDPELPNFAGDWFPGWDGCWSPNVSEEGRELIRKHLGLEDPDPQVLLAKHSKKAKSDAA